MFEIDEISLLVYLNRINRKDLVKTLCKYTGCHEDDYPKSEIARLLEKAGYESGNIAASISSFAI